MNTPNLLVIAGNQLRHQYFVNQLNFHFPLSAVFTEHFEHPETAFKGSEESEGWKQFFISRRKAEEQYLTFSNNISAQNIPKFFNIGQGLINHDETLQAVRSFSPTKIIIFGTSLLGSKYLKLYPNCIFNLHVGLSQYYRGSSCNFWPIHELRPDLLGATIHYVEKGIDNGQIVNQDTIQLEENDSEYILMVKTVILGTKLMIDCINKPNANPPIKEKQRKSGKLYLMKHFTPQAVLKVRHLVTAGRLKQKIAIENQHRTENNIKLATNEPL